MILVLLFLKRIGIKVPKYVLFKIIYAAKQKYYYGFELVKNYDLNLVLTKACQYNNFFLTETAIKKGATDLNRGLYIARKNNHTEIVEFLQKNAFKFFHSKN